MGDTIVIETPVATVLEVSGLQGPQGPTGPQGPAGSVSGSIAWDNVTGKPSTFTPSSHTHVAADVTDLSLNKVPEARQTFNITSTNSAAPTQVDAQSAFQTASGSIDCVIVLNNTTGIVYADIVVPDILGTSGSQRGRVIIEATTSGGGDITNFRINAEGTSIYPATGYDEIQPTERLVLVWTGDNWNLESLHTASSPVRISLPSYAGTLPAYANSVPTTPTSNGSPGMLFYSVAQDRLYICVATNTWRRIPIATW